MKQGNTIVLPLLIRKILLKYSDDTHNVSLPMIQKYLEEDGISADRRTIYNAIHAINETGDLVALHRNRSDGGYHIDHPITKEEAFLLLNILDESTALTEEEYSSLREKILSLISIPAQKDLPNTHITEHCIETPILPLLRILLDAIASLHPVEFLYYDLSLSKTKNYRKDKKIYHLVPYAIVSRNGKFYCIFYSEKHHSFANYRLDKMDHVQICEEIAVPVHFSLADHLRTSFQMYHGSAQTITGEFHINLANAVLDEFGDNLLISKVNQDTFTASIRTAITPTLIGWLLQYYDQIHISYPKELKEKLLHIASHIQKEYQE